MTLYWTDFLKKFILELEESKSTIKSLNEKCADLSKGKFGFFFRFYLRIMIKFSNTWRVSMSEAIHSPAQVSQE